MAKKKKQRQYIQTRTHTYVCMYIKYSFLNEKQALSLVGRHILCIAHVVVFVAA